MKNLYYRLRALGRPFWLLWIGETTSMFGTQLVQFALGVWIYERTGSVLNFAASVVASVLPAVLVMPIAGFKYTKETPKQFKRTDLDRAVTREFCAECGTHVVTRPPGLPGVVVKVGTLDDPALFDGPQIAIYTVDKQPYHPVPEGMPSFERLPQR